MNKRDLLILSVSGKPGLYQLIGQAKSGIFARHIGTGKRIVASPMSVSMLDDIVIYTYDDKIPLKQVMKRMAAHDGDRPSPRASKTELTDYFRQILPDYDEDQFYPSHMKKLLQWFGQLQEAGLLEDFVAQADDEPGNE